MGHLVYLVENLCFIVLTGNWESLGNLKQENGLDSDSGGWFKLGHTAALYTSWEDIIGQVKNDVLGMIRNSTHGE